MKNTIHSSAPNVLVESLTNALSTMRAGGSPEVHPTLNEQRIRTVTLRPLPDISIQASLQSVDNADEVDLHIGLTAATASSRSAGAGTEVLRECIGNHTARWSLGNGLVCSNSGNYTGFFDSILARFVKFGKDLTGSTANPEAVLTQRATHIVQLLSQLMHRLDRDMMDPPEHGITSVLDMTTSIRREWDNGLTVSISLAARHGDRILRYLVVGEKGFFHGDRDLPVDEAMELAAFEAGKDIMQHLYEKDPALKQPSLLVDKTADEAVADVLGDEVFMFLMGVADAELKDVAKAMRVSRGTAVIAIEKDDVQKSLFSGHSFSGKLTRTQAELVTANLTGALCAGLSAATSMLSYGYQANYRQRAEEMRAAIANDLQSL